MENKTASRSVERRFFQVQPDKLEFRIAGDEENGFRIEGQVAVFDTWSKVHTDFRERIAPTFFDDALKSSDVRSLFNHDPNFVLGRTASRTLRISRDDESLMMENELSDSSIVRDLVVIPMQRGDITGASFSFTLPETGGDVWRKGADGILERTLVRAEAVFDVGPVTFPFYDMTRLDVLSSRTLEAAVEARSRLIGEAETRTETEASNASDVVLVDLEGMRRRSRKLQRLTSTSVKM